MRRWPIVLLVVAALVAGLWFVIAFSEKDGGPTAIGGALDAAAPPAAARAQEPAGDAGASDVAPTPALAAVPFAPAEASPPAAPDGTPEVAGEPAGRLRLRGSFVAVAPDGTEHATESGTFDLVTLQGREPHQQVVEVDGGRWECDVPPDPTALHASDAVLGGRAVFLAEEAIPFPPERFLALRGTCLGSVLIDVKDLDTGAALTGVRVLAGRDWEYEARPEDPASARVLVADGASPVAVPPPKRARKGLQSCWVTAAGHDWQKVKLDHRSPARRQVLLGGAGDLVVTIEGQVPEGSVLRLRPGEDAVGRRAFEVAVPSERTVRIDRVPAGRHVVSVEKGPWYEHPVIAGSTVVDVTAGAEVPIRIVCSSTAVAPPMVPFAGVLLVPEAWGAFKPSMTVDAIGATEVWAGERWRTLELSPGEEKPAGWTQYQWSAGPVPAGAWQVVVGPFEHRVRVDLGPAGDEHVRIEVPPPAEIVVRVQSCATKEPIAATSLTWHARLPEGVNSWSSESVAPGDVTGEFRFRAPLGWIDVSVDAEGWTPGAAEREVVSSPTEIVLELDRECGIVVTVKDGEAALPWDERWHFFLRAPDARSSWVGWRANKVTVRDPGTYELTVGDIEGYEPVPKRTVVIPPATLVPITIELERLQ